jgi:transposase
MQPETANVRISQIIFDEIVYPRKDHDPVLVQRYADSLEEIEAAGRLLALSPDLKLLDGKHRWLAYRKRYDGEDREIQALIYPVTTPHEQLKLACKLNADHGWQLTEDDKEADAKALYAFGMSYDEIAVALSVGKAKISAWLARTVKENKDNRDRRIIEMWMAYHTQEEIATRIKEPIGTVKRLLGDGEDSLVRKVLQNQTNQAAYSHATDFDSPPYTVWKQQEKTPGSSHFGNSEVRFVDNLLYRYTQPFDVMVDPFAGGGSTIDICRKRWRRYWVSDRKPIPEREDQIRKHDVTDGLPPLHRWQDVKLVYLDPPYWRQAAGQYSNDPEDLANMALDRFTDTLAGIINAFAKKLSPGAVIALLMQPTQWKADNHEFTDHVADMIRLVKLPIDMRVQCPYESQQCTAQMVEWGKKNRNWLVLSRELVIWRV